MHYYKFNVSDWVMNTSHLSLEEEAIYLRLVNYYYDSEKPIPLETHSVIRRLRLASHSETVDIVLKEFFTKTDEGWTHSKCDKLLAEYHARAERNRKNGSRGGRKPKEEKTQEKPTGLEVGTQEEPTLVNHKLLTTNQELETNNNNKNTKSRSNKLDYSSWPSMPSEQVMKDWLALRTRLKANVSQTVINRFAKEFIKAAGYGLTVDYCLTECVAKGWRGFEADWLIKNQPTNQHSGVQQMSSAAEQTFRNLEDGF